MTDPVPVPSVPDRARTAPSAIWSFVLGILSFTCGGFLTAIPAIICGHIARSSIRNSDGALEGKGFALAGLVLGYINLALHIILVPLFVIPMMGKFTQELNRDGGLSVGHTTELIATDGRGRLTVPSSWRPLPELHEAASIKAGNKSQEQYVILLSESKVDVPEMTLQKHHETTRNRMLEGMTNPNGTLPVELTINGFPALQDEISGVQEEVYIAFLHTTIDDGENFHQLLVWTLKSRFEKSKKRLQEVAATFRAR